MSQAPNMSALSSAVQSLQLQAQSSSRGARSSENQNPGFRQAPNVDVVTSQMMREMMQKLPQYAQMAHSRDLESMYEGVHQIRRLLSVERNPPIGHVFESGVVPQLIKIVNMRPKDTGNNRDLLKRLQFEATWALTNISSGDSEHATRLVHLGVVQALSKLLERTQDVETADQAVWGLGNVAGDSPLLRDMVVKETKTMEYILANLESFPLSMQRNAVWTLSNFSRGQPRPPWERVRQMIVPLTRLLRTSADMDIWVDILWTLSFLTEDWGDQGPREGTQIDAVLETGIMPGVIAMMRKMIREAKQCHEQIAQAREQARHHGQNEPVVPEQVQQLMRSADFIVAPSVRMIGNIVSGTDEQTEHIVNSGYFEVIEDCISHRVTNIRKEACWTLSNVVAGTQRQLDAFFQKPTLVRKLIELGGTGDVNVRKEAGWCLSNAVCGASFEQVQLLVQAGILEVMCSLLKLQNVEKVLLMAMECIDGVLTAYNRKFGRPMNGFNEFAERVEEHGGLEALEEIQANDQISDRCADSAAQLVVKFWGDEQTEEMDGQQANAGENAFMF